MRKPFASHLRHPISVLTAFTNLIKRPQTTVAADLRRAGHCDGKVLSPRESAKAAIRVSRTYC